MKGVTRRVGRVLRGSLISFSLLAIVLLGVYVWQYWQHNNADTEPPTEQELEVALQGATAWLTAHKTQILAQNNPMLWWMVQRSVILGGDKQLESLFAEFKQQYLRNKQWHWRMLFNEHDYVPVHTEFLLGKAYYYWLILYGLSCDVEIGALPLVQAQLDAQFCHHGEYQFRPACITHQMMGLRFMQTRNCGELASTQNTIAQLQNTLVAQLTWDIRLVDVFIQRIVMLTESGAADSVQTSWLRRFLSAQLPDGGWGGFHPLLPLPNDHALGFSRLGFAVEKVAADFHATAQAVFLLSMLRSSQEYGKAH